MRPARSRRFASLPTLLALSLAVSGLFVGPTRATNLPPGFEETVVVSNPFPENFNQLAWAPDGTLFIADKPGRMYAWMDSGGPEGTYELRLIAELLVNAEGERGVNGLAVDPDYMTNRHVWVYYTTRQPNHNRVSRFTFDGQQLTNEHYMLDGPPTLQTDHNSGCIRFAADGTLFIAMGDDFQGAVTSQDPFDLRGKILHINRDGSPAADNPFLDGVDGDPRVWAMGLRNPYRISIQPETQNVFIADVGFARFEELDIGFPGANFGWPYVEGPNPPGLPYDYPIYSYDHNGAGAAIIGGDHVGSGDFAPQYEGDYFYAEFVQKELYRVILDATNTVQEVELFATDFGRATDMQFGPEGSLYYVCRSCNPASVRKISYVGGDNTQPVAVASADPTGGPAPLAVSFDGSESTDADDDELSFDWEFGDGSTSDEVSPDHVFQQGVHEARLSVTDEHGGSDQAPAIRIVSGNSPPSGEILSPLDESTYFGGATIDYSGTSSDPEDGELPCSAFSWQVIFHHNTHTHPFLGPIQGICGGTFVTPVIGERAPDQWYEIRMTVRDSGQPLGDDGWLEATRSINLRPQLVSMNFLTSPLPDLDLTLDTVPFTAPSSVVGVTGMTRDVGTPDLQQGSDGLWYRWSSWSDGGEQLHTLTTPASHASYTASFECVPFEVTDLELSREGPELVMSWEDDSPLCFGGGAERYRIYAASRAEPSDGDGEFPQDPGFRLVGTSSDPSFRYIPESVDRYFLVVGVNPTGQSGVAGHYGE